jgi:RHS repeat-associated protein
MGVIGGGLTKLRRGGSGGAAHPLGARHQPVPKGASRHSGRIARRLGAAAASASLAAGLLAAIPATARAATGDEVGQVTFSQACSSGIGVGITYDGSNLWYSCHNQSPDLFRADPTTGAVTGSWDIAGGLGSLAYDASRNAIWAGWSGPGEGNIWLVSLDASHSVTSSSVAFSTCPQLCFIDIDDGLAYDASDDSLYISPDTSTTVYHYSTTGTALGSFPWAGTSCYNSGLGLGGNDLYEGSDGCNEVWVVAKSNPSTVLLSFSTGGVRDESLTCDPNTFAAQGDTVMWSKEAYSPIAYAFQIPAGSCGSGGTNSGPPVGGPIGTSEQTSGNPSELPVQCQNGSNPVNCATGNFWHSFTDLAVPGRGISLSLTRTYNSLLAGTSGPFGFGWSSSYTMSLTIDPSGNVTVHQENGSTILFNPNGSGGYIAPPRVLANLVKNSDGSYTLTRRQRQKFTFSAAGALTAETDLNGYTTSLVYNGSGQLSSVTDPAGRSLTFSYTSGGEIATATDPSGRKMTYSYDANGNLTSTTDPAGETWSFTYNSSHLLLTMTDARGGVVSNTYDASGRVVSQSDAMKRTTTFDYTSIPGSTKITDANGSVTVEAYSYGELISITKGWGTPEAATWSFSYDQNTLGMTVETDPNGHTTVFSYDQNGNRISTDDALHRKTTSTYDSLDDLTSTTDALGITTTYIYDANGNLLSASRPLAGTGQNATNTLTYGDSSHPGDVTGVTNPDGKTTSYAYDPDGDQVKVTDPDGNLTTLAYNSIGWRTSVVSPDGNVTGGNPSAYTTTYAYDALGRLTSVTDPLGHATTTTYDGDGNVVTSTDADGNATSSTYDADNELTKTTRADGSIVATAYDADGNVTSQTDGAGHVTSYVYDALNRLQSTTDPLGRKTSHGYDAAGNATTLTDPSGETTTYSYDAANQMTSIAYSDGKTPSATYTYDADGERIQMTDGSGTTTYTYDSLGRLTATIDGAGSTVDYNYDLAGNITTLTYPNGKAVTQTYDAAGRMTGVTDWLGKTTSFSYDASSNLTTESYPNGVSASSTFNAASQLMDITDTAGSTQLANFGYTRDAAGQLTSDTSQLTGATILGDTFQRANQEGWGTASDGLVWSGTGSGSLSIASDEGLISNSSTSSTFETLGSTTVGDANGLVRFSVASSSDTAGIILHFEDASDMDLARYDGDSHLAFMVQQGGSWSTLAQTSVTVQANTRYWLRFEIQGKNVYLKLWADGTSEPSSWTLTGSTDANQSPGTAGLYGYANTGSPVSFDSFSVSAPSAVTAYKYTPLQQLCYAATTNSSSCSSPPSGATVYSYNAADNLTSDAGTTQGFDAADELCWSLSGTSGNACSSPPSGATSYSYDTRGNRTGTTPPSGGPTTYGYDQANRLVSYQMGSTTTATYAYDGDGERMSKTVNGSTTQFTWDQAGDLLQQQSGPSVTDFVYGPGGLPIEQIGGSTTDYLQHDQSGSTRLMTDVGGTEIASFTFTPYGTLAASTGSITTPLLYGGQYYDSESDLYYLRARYYDPATAQFLTVDPLVAVTLTPYGYVAGDPLNRADPSGLYSYQYSELIGAVAETGGAGAVMQYLQANLGAVFPFSTGGCNSVRSGASCNLSPLGFPDRIRISSVTCTSFSFATTPGNTTIGPGGSITFSTFAEGSNVYLRETANAPNAPWWVNVGVALGVAQGTWDQLATNLQNAVAPGEWTYSPSNPRNPQTGQVYPLPGMEFS